MKIATITMSAAAAVLMLAPFTRAADTPAANPVLTVLSRATQAELPGRAADLVAQAGAKEQRQTTIDVVKAALGLNPAAAAVTVGSIAQATPAMAPVAAGTAAALVPNQATTIARAAAVAAPKQAGQIVEAICRVLPADYTEVAEAVADVVPGAGKEILTGVAVAIPALKGPIDQVLASQKVGVPSVSEVMERVVGMASVASVSSVRTLTLTGDSQPLYDPPPNSVKPPYVVPPSSPINLELGAGTTVPSGGRNYANP